MYEYLAEEIQALKDRHGDTHGVFVLLIIFLFNSHISCYRHRKIVHGKGSPHGMADSVVFLTVEVKDAHIVLQDTKTGLYTPSEVIEISLYERCRFLSFFIVFCPEKYF